MRPCPMRIKRERPDLLLRFQSESIVVDFAVRLTVGGADELRVGTAQLREWNIAWSRLVQVEIVVEPSSAHAAVRGPQAHLPDLMLQGYVELVNPPVFRVNRKARDALRRNVSGSRGERIRKREQRNAVRDRIEESLRKLKRAAGVREPELPQKFRNNAIPGAEQGLVPQPVCKSQARRKIPSIGMDDRIA